ncbi:MAG: response regulator transcription factor [Candidatus Promineifilaceae bacterium]
MEAIVIANNHEDRDLFSYLLRRAGLTVSAGSDLHRAVVTHAEKPIDIVLVSSTPNALLVKMVESAHAAIQAPLIVLVDQLTEDVHCLLLEVGADLVLERPVSPRILSRYVSVLLRRAADARTFIMPALEMEKLTLDPASRTVKILDKDPQQLTQLEFRLLYVLMTNRGQVIPFETIVERVWGYTGEGNRELVRGLIRRLRRKIEPNHDKPHFIQNVTGVGYLFALEE